MVADVAGDRRKPVRAAGHGMNRATRRRMRRAKGLAGVSLVATAGLLGTYVGGPRAPRAYAASFSVTTTADAGAGSLRQAIADANGSPGSDTITIAATGTLTLAADLPIVTESLTVAGPGADQFTIDGNDQFRPFEIDASSAQDVRVSELTITAAADSAILVPGADSSVQPNLDISAVTFSDNTSSTVGAAIAGAQAGALTISDSTFAANTADIGGAVYWYTRNHPLTIASSQFIDNSGESAAGAVLAFTAQTTIEDSLFRGNVANTGGAALLATTGDPADLAATPPGAADMVIRRSQFTSNVASDGNAGAVMMGAYFYDEHGTASIEDSTFSANSASGQGAGVGGAVVSLATIDVVNATLSGNRARIGGALFGPISGPLSLRFSTVTGNHSDSAGAVYTYHLAPATVVTASIVQNNTVGPTPTGGADLTVAGLMGSNSAFTSAETTAVTVGGAPHSWDPGDDNLFTAAALVDPLGDNGGFVLPDGSTIATMLPPAGSSVLDQVPDTVPAPDFDERGPGFARVTNSKADIGAVERAIEPPTPTVTPTPTPTVIPTPPTAPPTPPAPTTPPPKPTPTPTPVKPVRTILIPAARPDVLRIRTDRPTTLVYRVRTNGKIRKVRAWCTLQRQTLSKRDQRQLCGISVRPTKAVGGTRLRIRTAPSCSSGLRFHVRISAKAVGKRPVLWSRTWRGADGHRCALPGTG